MESDYCGKIVCARSQHFWRNFKGLPQETICCGSKHRPWLGQQEPGGPWGELTLLEGSSANMTWLHDSRHSAITLGQVVEKLQFADWRDGISFSLIFPILVCKIDSCSVSSLITPIFVKEMSCWSSMSILFRVL